MMETETFPVKEEVKHLDFKYIEKEIQEFTIQQNETFHFYEERINDLLGKVQLAKKKLEEQKKAKEEEQQKKSVKEPLEVLEATKEEIPCSERKKEGKRGSASCNPVIKELIKDVKDLKINEKISEKNKLFYNALLVSYREIMSLLKYENPEIFKNVAIKKNIILRLILLHFLQKGDFFMYYVLNDEILKKIREKEKLEEKEKEEESFMETSEEDEEREKEREEEISPLTGYLKNRTPVESIDIAIQCKGVTEHTEAEDGYIDEFINIIEKIEDDIMQGREEKEETRPKHFVLLNNVSRPVQDMECSEASIYAQKKKEYLQSIHVDDSKEEVMFEHALIEKEIFDAYHKFHIILYNLKNFKTRECIKWFKNCGIEVKRKYAKLCYLLHCIMYLMYSKEDRRKALDCLRSLMSAHRRNRDHISRLSTFICIGVDNVFFKNMFGNVHSKIFSYFKRAFNEEGVKIIRNFKSVRSSLKNAIEINGLHEEKQPVAKEEADLINADVSKSTNKEEEEGRTDRKRKKEKITDNNTDEGKERNSRKCVKISEGHGKKKRKKGSRSFSFSKKDKYGIMDSAFRSVSDMDEFIEQTERGTLGGKKKCKLEKIIRKSLLKYEGERAEKRMNQKGKRKAEMKEENKRRKLDNRNYVLCKKKYTFKLKEEPTNIPILHNNIYREEYSQTLFDNEYVLKREDCSHPLSEEFLENKLRSLIKREEQMKSPFFYNGNRLIENGGSNLILPKISKEGRSSSEHRKRESIMRKKKEEKELGITLHKGWYHYVHNCTKDIFSEISETKNFAEFSLHKRIMRKNEIYYRKEYMEEEDPVYLFEQSDNEMNQMYKKSTLYKNYKTLNRAIQHYDDKNTKINKGSNHFLNSGYVYNVMRNTKEDNYESIYEYPHNITPYNVNMWDTPNYSEYFVNKNTFQYLNNSCFHRVPNTSRRKFQKCKILNRIYRGKSDDSEKKPFSFLRGKGTFEPVSEEKKKEEKRKTPISCAIERTLNRFAGLKANTIYVARDYIDSVLNHKKKIKGDFDFFHTDDNADNSDSDSQSSDGSNTSFKSNHSSGFSTENFFIDSDNDEKIKKGMNRVKEEVDNIKEDYLKKNTIMTLLNTKNCQANNRAILSNKGSRITKSYVDISRILLSPAYSNKDSYSPHNIPLDLKNSTLYRRMYMYFKSKGYFSRTIFRTRKKGECSEDKKRKKKKKSNSSSKVNKKNKKDKHTKKNRKDKRRSLEDKKKEEDPSGSSQKINETKDSSDDSDSDSNSDNAETKEPENNKLVEKESVTEGEKKSAKEELRENLMYEEEKEQKKPVKEESEETENKSNKYNKEEEEEEKMTTASKKNKNKIDKTEEKEKERKKEEESLSNKKGDKPEKSSLGISIFGIEDILEFTKKKILFDKTGGTVPEKENNPRTSSVKNSETNKSSLNSDTAKKRYSSKERKNNKLEKTKEEEKEKYAEKEKTEESTEKEGSDEKTETEKTMDTKEKEETIPDTIDKDKEIQGKKENKEEKEIQVKMEKQENKETQGVVEKEEKNKDASLEKNKHKEGNKTERALSPSEKEKSKKEKKSPSEEPKKEKGLSKKEEKSKYSMKNIECRIKKEKKDIFFGSYKRNVKKRRHETEFALEDKDMKRNRKESNDSKLKNNHLRKEFITTTIMRTLAAAANRAARSELDEDNSSSTSSSSSSNSSSSSSDNDHDNNHREKGKRKTNKESDNKKKNINNKKNDGPKDKKNQKKSENREEKDKDKGNNNEKEEKPKENIMLERKVFVHLESPLSLLVCGGLVSSKKLIEAQAIFKENKRLQVGKKNNTFNSDVKNGTRSHDKSKNKNNKQETGALIPNSLAIEVDLGARFFFHSSFTCPISRDKSSIDNGPYLLPCGHAICKNCLDKIHAQRSRHLKCPMCPQNLHIAEIMPLYFT